MNVTSTTALSCSVATLSSESLPNDDEKPNQPKKFLIPNCDYGKICEACILVALSRSSIHHKIL